MLASWIFYNSIANLRSPSSTVAISTTSHAGRSVIDFENTAPDVARRAVAPVGIQLLMPMQKINIISQHPAAPRHYIRRGAVVNFL